GGAAGELGDGEGRALADGDDGAAAEEEAGEGAVPGDDTVVDEDVVLELEGDGLRRGGARGSDVAFQGGDDPGLVGLGGGDGWPERSQERERNECPCDPHANRLLTPKPQKAARARSTSQKPPLNAVMRLALACSPRRLHRDATRRKTYARNRRDRRRQHRGGATPVTAGERRGDRRRRWRGRQDERRDGQRARGERRHRGAHGGVLGGGIAALDRLGAGGGAAGELGDGEGRALADGDDGAAAEEEAGEGAVPGDDTVVDEDVVLELEGDGLRRGGARGSDVAFQGGDDPGLVGLGGGDGWPERSQERERNECPCDPHANRLLTPKPQKAARARSTSQKPPLNAVMRLALAC